MEARGHIKAEPRLFGIGWLPIIVLIVVVIMLLMIEGWSLLPAPHPQKIDRAAQTPPPRFSRGQFARLVWGSTTAIEVARTPEDFGQWTKCFDVVEGVTNCVARLMMRPPGTPLFSPEEQRRTGRSWDWQAAKVFGLPSGTKVEIAEIRDNPLHPSVLNGQLVEVLVLEGLSRGQLVWTLENYLTLEGNPPGPTSAGPTSAGPAVNEATISRDVHPAKPIDVTLKLTVELAEGNRPILRGTTNLPNGTHLMTSVLRPPMHVVYPGWGSWYEPRCIVQNGAFTSGPYDPLSTGEYVADATMPFADLEPASVQAIVGKLGEHLTGPLVRFLGDPSWGYTVSSTTTFQIGDADAVEAIRRQERTVRVKAHAIMAEMLQLVQKGRAMKSLRVRQDSDVAAGKLCMDLMSSYERKLKTLETRASEIPHMYYPTPNNALFAVSGTIWNCITCSSDAYDSCDNAESFLKNHAKTDWLLSGN